MAEVTRRAFIKAAAVVGSGLTIGMDLSAWSSSPTPGSSDLRTTLRRRWDPTVFVQISSDDTVTVYCKHTEMGQGIHTGMATVVAEELDAAWAQMRPVGAPSNSRLYSNLIWEEQMTGGSTSLVNSIDQLREVAAAARLMLVGAAAAAWHVSDAEVTVVEGQVRHTSTKRAFTFGELADRAARQPFPNQVSLKRSDEYRLIGRRLPRTDIASKIDGSAIYTIDVHLPGMLTAAVAHPPRFGATLASVDSRSAKAMPGVVDVVQIPTGVAVIADGYWTARQACNHLNLTWQEELPHGLSSADIHAQFMLLRDASGVVAREVGNASSALAAAASVVEAEFHFP